MADERLATYLDGVRVGTLQQNAHGGLSFEYDDTYRHDPSTVPLSLSMPKAEGTHTNKRVLAFIAGLLPDSEPALQRLGRKYGVSANNPFALLGHIGRDAAGAVQVLPMTSDCDDAAGRQGSIEWLSDEDVDRTLNDLARSPESWDPGRYAGRWSLAGAQSKIALFRSPQGRWGVPCDSTPTTHILKPSMPRFAGHHLNEHLCLRAAQLCGLPAADTDLLTTDRYEVLIARRYDRILDNTGRWRRLHQEDLCQALSVPPAKKYQSDGGPGITQIGRLLATSGLPASQQRNLRTFFDYLVYNVAIAATDAHAKNFSLLLSARDIRLAPLYDVASFLPYDQESRLQSAMKIGEHWDMTSVTEKDWAAVGTRLGLTRDEAIDRARTLRAKMPAAFATAASEPGIPDSLRDQAQRIAALITA
ncbi:type II toxin-antitoxin system HipA family toxin [Kribbella sp. NPDC051587]|uniref:type II toxin-antitoxin system HipA family toxin n=1 Tax=Kribbella sp. NPDC051587 TaxID=3364119 RepID=UPI0037A7D75A